MNFAQFIKNLRPETLLKLQNNFHYIDALNSYAKSLIHTDSKSQQLQSNLQNLSNTLLQYDYILIIGVGGTITAIQAVILMMKNTIALSSKFNHNHIIFIDSLDQKNINNIILQITNKKIAIIFLSASGKSSETIIISQYLLANISPHNTHLFLFTNNYNIIHQHFENYSNNSSFINYSDLSTSSHYTGPIKGRFSIFSPCAILLLKMIGADYIAFGSAAQDVIYALHSLLFPSIQNTTHINLNIEKSIIYKISRLSQIIFNVVSKDKTAISLASDSSLQFFNQWFSLLVVESLGKNDLSPQFFPIPLNTAQHTYFQSFLSHQNNKNHLIFLLDSSIKSDSSIASLQKISLNAIINDLSIAGKKAHYSLHQINLADPTSISSYFMISICATIIAGQILSADPLSQNTVDNLKFQIYHQFFKNLK